jgi:methylamine dehydrogenase light chain
VDGPQRMPTTKEHAMSLFEKAAERGVRGIARSTSRRGFLGRLGHLIVGGAAIPLLPVARASDDAKPPAKGYPGVSPQPSLNPAESGDPASCDYWRYCGTGAPLCACCGGSANACPPGTEMSPLSWIGTCRNPVDGKNYIISYNDCCGKPTCNRCPCERRKPDARATIVRPQTSGSYLWCLGTQNTSFTCGTANVLGVALDQD